MPKARLSLNSLNLTAITNLIIPAFSIAMLGMIESLLCGASAGKMKNEKLNADQELFAQGIGNMVILFLEVFLLQLLLLERVLRLKLAVKRV